MLHSATFTFKPGVGRELQALVGSLSGVEGDKGSLQCLSVSDTLRFCFQFNVRQMHAAYFCFTLPVSTCEPAPSFTQPYTEQSRTCAGKQKTHLGIVQRFLNELLHTIKHRSLLSRLQIDVSGAAH